MRRVGTSYRTGNRRRTAYEQWFVRIVEFGSVCRAPIVRVEAELHLRAWVGDQCGQHLIEVERWESDQVVGDEPVAIRDRDDRGVERRQPERHQRAAAQM